MIKDYLQELPNKILHIRIFMSIINIDQVHQFSIIFESSKSHQLVTYMRLTSYVTCYNLVPNSYITDI